MTLQSWERVACGMKPRERGGVLDPKLNVHGVEGPKAAGRSKIIFLVSFSDKSDVSIPHSNVMFPYSRKTPVHVKQQMLVVLQEKCPLLPGIAPDNQTSKFIRNSKFSCEEWPSTQIPEGDPSSNGLHQTLFPTSSLTDIQQDMHAGSAQP